MSGYHAIPTGDELVAQVEIVSESEDASCWQFIVQVLDDEGTLTRHRMRLAWADFNLWSPDGTDSPARVAEAVMHFLLSHASASDVPESFDASVARRRFAGADERIPQYIRP